MSGVIWKQTGGISERAIGVSGGAGEAYCDTVLNIISQCGWFCLPLVFPQPLLRLIIIKSGSSQFCSHLSNLQSYWTGTILFELSRDMGELND